MRTRELSGGTVSQRHLCCPASVCSYFFPVCVATPLEYKSARFLPLPFFLPWRSLSFTLPHFYLHRFWLRSSSFPLWVPFHGPIANVHRDSSHNVAYLFIFSVLFLLHTVADNFSIASSHILNSMSASRIVHRLLLWEEGQASPTW